MIEDSATHCMIQLSEMRKLIPTNFTFLTSYMSVRTFTFLTMLRPTTLEAHKHQIRKYDSFSIKTETSTHLSA